MTTIPVPNGHIADIVTHLEMTTKPTIEPMESSLSLEPWTDADPSDYLALFRKVGQRWLWLSRLLISEEELSAIIHHPEVELFLVRRDRENVGFIELNFRQAGQCEIGFFGLVPELNGQGHGRWLMAETLTRAWREGVERVWLHTCTLDSPRALGFYQNSGFVAFKREVGMGPDPRLTGDLPMDAGPHIPIIS